jgi:hypothetical protein
MHVIITAMGLGKWGLADQVRVTQFIVVIEELHHSLVVRVPFQHGRGGLRSVGDADGQPGRPVMLVARPGTNRESILLGNVNHLAPQFRQCISGARPLETEQQANQSSYERVAISKSIEPLERVLVELTCFRFEPKEQR